MANRSKDALWADCKAAFDVFDRDGDGHITSIELATIIDHLGMSWDQQRLRQMIKDVDRNDHLGISWDQQRLRQMIKDVDRNGNGTIEFEEFLQMMQREEERKDREAELIAAFQVFDRHHQGFVSGATLRLILTRLGATPFHENIDDLVRQVDRTGSGRIYYKGIAKTLYRDTTST